LFGAYFAAAVAHICEFDLSDDEDERLQKAVDFIESKSGVLRQVREEFWAELVENISNDKAKVCREATADVQKFIAELPEDPR
jgi:hypothetical protein